MKINYETTNKVLENLIDRQVYDADFEKLADIDLIDNLLRESGVKATKDHSEVDCHFARYFFTCNSATATKKALRLADDVCAVLGCQSVRAYTVGEFLCYEVAILPLKVVGLKSLLEETVKDEKGDGCYCPIGQKNGSALSVNLCDMPNLLVAGGVASGKSVLLHDIVVSLVACYCADELNLLLIDPKGVEFGVYDGLPHLAGENAITKADQAVAALARLQEKVDLRYDAFMQCGVKNINEYNAYAQANNLETMCKIVVVIDELADLLFFDKKAVESLLVALATKGRAAGVHLVVATQRASKEVVTASIGACFPARIACRLLCAKDSKLIVGVDGAEKLVGRGDLLYKDATSTMPVRAVAGYVSAKELCAVVSSLAD